MFSNTCALERILVISRKKLKYNHGYVSSKQLEEEEKEVWMRKTEEKSHMRRVLEAAHY